MKLRDLEIRLERLEGLSYPSVKLEQYPTPAPLAARMLYDAFMRGDIEGKRVLDPGAGTGVLAIGASLLGASEVIAVEVDPDAVSVAERNTLHTGTDVHYITSDVKRACLSEELGMFDTAVMNPPFGAQNAHADRPFLDLALRTANVTYGIFNAGSREFINGYIRGRGTISDAIGGKCSLKRTFSFHRKDRLEINVEILRIVREPDSP
ncbi:MAG: METTL5 family protein [Methanoregulaceae archaeon]